MKLSFKNKLFMGIQRMCDEGAKKGGIPDMITLSSQEAHDLLHELHYLQSEVRNGNIKGRDKLPSLVKFQPSAAPPDLCDPEHPIYLTRMVNDYDTYVNNETIKHVVAFWIEGSILATYEFNLFTVPLVIENPKKADESGW